MPQRYMMALATEQYDTNKARDLLRTMEAGDTSTLLRLLDGDTSPAALALWIGAHLSIRAREEHEKESSDEQ